jgi:hypothetical protein
MPAYLELDVDAVVRQYESGLMKWLEEATALHIPDDVKKAIDSTHITLIYKDGRGVILPMVVDRRYFNIRSLFWHPWWQSNTHAILNMHYLPFDVLVKLRELAIKYLPYYDYHVFIIHTVPTPAREYIQKLLTLSHLVTRLGITTREAHGIGALAGFFEKYVEELHQCRDNLDCMIEVTLRAREKAIEETQRRISNWVRWLRRRVELHNLVIRLTREYVREIRITETSPSDPALRWYGSNVSYSRDGTIRVEARKCDAVSPLALLGGAEENNKFFRAKLDVIGGAKSLGSWLFGLDLTTQQSFTITLPRNCVVMPLHICREYAFGLRDNRLRKTVKEDIEINEY